LCGEHSNAIGNSIRAVLVNALAVAEAVAKRVYVLETLDECMRVEE